LRSGGMVGNEKIVEVLNYIRFHPEVGLEEIIEETKTTKGTTNKILINLLENNIILLNDKKYSLNPNFCCIDKTAKNTDTYFNIEILEEHKQTIIIYSIL
jgi:DNA-binding IclR family transcriptional regulator